MDWLVYSVLRSLDKGGVKPLPGLSQDKSVKFKKIHVVLSGSNDPHINLLLCPFTPPPPICQYFSDTEALTSSQPVTVPSDSHPVCRPNDNVVRPHLIWIHSFPVAAFTICYQLIDGNRGWRLSFSLGGTKIERTRKEDIRGTEHVRCFEDKGSEARMRWQQRRDSEHIRLKQASRRPAGGAKMGFKDSIEVKSVVVRERGLEGYMVTDDWLQPPLKGTAPKEEMWLPGNPASL